MFCLPVTRFRSSSSFRSICSGHLAEAKQGADLGAVALDGAARDCWKLGRFQPNAELPRHVGNRSSTRSTT